MKPSEYLTKDHRRLEGLLDEALRGGSIDMEKYDRFRSGLLRHVSIEEHIVLPLIRERAEDGFFAIQQLRLEHGAIAALLVPPPDQEVVTVLRALLAKHNLLEETQDTLYDVLDHCASTDRPELLTHFEMHPDVPLSKHINNPKGLEHAKRAIQRAGYTWEELLADDG